RLEALSLLVPREVEEELEDGRPLLDEHALPIVDLAVAALALALRDEVVDADDDHVLVVAPVEDRDLALRGDALVDAPEVVVVELDLGRLLEGRDVDPHGVHALEDVAYDAVFPGGVHALEDDEELVLVLGEEELLELLELAPEALE